VKISRETLGRVAWAIAGAEKAHECTSPDSCKWCLARAEAAVEAALEPDVEVSVPTNQRFPILSVGDKYPKSHTYALVRNGDGE